MSAANDGKPIRDPAGILTCCTSDKARCKFRSSPSGSCRNTPCRAELSGYISDKRDYILRQNPYLTDFEWILKDFLSYQLCTSARHRDIFKTNHWKSLYLHNAVKELVEEMRAGFAEAFNGRTQMPGGFHELKENFDGTEMLDTTALQEYITKFDAQIGCNGNTQTEEERSLQLCSTTVDGRTPHNETTNIRNGSSRRPCSMLLDVARRLAAEEKRSGYVYICTGTPKELAQFTDEHFLKIGYSEEPLSRVASIEKSCGYDTVLHSFWETRFAKRVEKLVHAELKIRGLQQVYQCTGPNCLEKHQEWFNITAQDAQEVVEHWVGWIRDYEPYNADGSISDNGHKLIATDFPNKFLVNSIGMPWHQPYSESQQTDYEYCVCTSKASCTKSHNISTPAANGLCRVNLSPTSTPNRSRLENRRRRSSTRQRTDRLRTPRRSVTPESRRVTRIQDEFDDAFDAGSPPPLVSVDSPDDQQFSANNPGFCFSPPTPGLDSQQSNNFSQESYTTCVEDVEMTDWQVAEGGDTLQLPPSLVHAPSPLSLPVASEAVLPLRNATASSTTRLSQKGANEACTDQPQDHGDILNPNPQFLFNITINGRPATNEQVPDRRGRTHRLSFSFDG